MSSPIDDEMIDVALRTWSRQVLDDTTADAFAVSRIPGDDARFAAAARRRSRLRAAAGAAAGVLLVVAAAIGIRGLSGRTTPPAATASACPARLPTSPQLEHAAAGQRLFAGQVASMTACSYRSLSPRPASRLAASVPLTHQLATEFADHLNRAASTSHDPLDCLTVVGFSVLIARDINGASLAPVVLTPGCRQLAASTTTTTRYLDVADDVYQRVTRYVTQARAGR